MTDEKFPCERCGICCRNIGNATFAKDMVLPSGVCKYLDEETNLGRIYSARPIFCNADAFYDKYLIDKLTRQEFYRQNKKACRRFQGLETSSEKFELEEWVLPAIQNLNAGQGLESLSAEDRAILEKAGVLDSAETSPAGAKPPGVPDELSLESMSEKERKIYEENNIKPFERNILPANAVPLKFREQVEANERTASLKAGKTPKDIEWELFEQNELEMNPPDHDIAEQHLDKYIELLSRSEKENICYERFLDFSKGRNKIKNFSFAEKMLKEISDTRDADKLLDIVSYFEQRRDLAKAEPFYFTLYEVFHRGEGTQKNLNKAIDYLKASIFGTNTDEKRKALRELYAEKSSESDEKKRIKLAYEQVIADNIQFAKNDYAVYLRDQKEYAEAIHWFVADGKFAEAYDIVNIKVKEKIESTIDEFKKAGTDADNKYLEALKLMQTKFESLQGIFEFDKPEKTPRTYTGIALMYMFFGILYAVFRTAQRSPLALFAGLLISGAAFFGGWKAGHIGWGAVSIALWSFVSMYMDVQRRKKFVSACRLWLELPEHPELKKHAAVFQDSQRVIEQPQNSWIFVLPVIAILFFSTMTFAVFEMPPDTKEEILTQIESERVERERADDSNETLQNKPPAAAQETDSTSSKDKEKPATPKVEEKPAAYSNPLLTQADVGKVFSNYYRAVNERRYTDAYSYLTPNCRNRLGSVEEFAVGHKDTLSVEILDFQQTAASSEVMNASYKILTHDRISNGVKVQTFAGQTTLIKVGDKWLIDYLSSKLVESHVE